jgi:thioredoxin 1
VSTELVSNLLPDEFTTAVAKGVTLVDFWAPWCQPCQMQSPILEQVAHAMGDRARICKVNVDENPSVARLYQIQGIPTLILFKNGVDIKRFIGVQAAEDLLEALENVCGINKE